MDDYYLGFTTELPANWCYTYGGKDKCYDCKELITTEKRGYGEIWESEEVKRYIESIFFCQPCYRKRKCRRVAIYQSNL